jgi:hypothetical protein
MQPKNGNRDVEISVSLSAFSVQRKVETRNKQISTPSSESILIRRQEDKRQSTVAIQKKCRELRARMDSIGDDRICSKSKKQALLNKFLSSEWLPLEYGEHHADPNHHVPYLFPAYYLCSILYLTIETYHMIDQCDASIATWSSDGASFVIKDVDEFAKVR